jgi:ATP-dependent DNA helicase RecG
LCRDRRASCVNRIASNAFTLSNTPTISHFGKNDLERRDEPLYPPAAIREGLVNAFAHRDYSDFSGGIAVRVYSNHLEIWNAGRLPEGMTPDSLASGHISVLRNPDIAHVLYLRGLMEKMGRGSVMIRGTCAERGLPLPQWSEDDRGVTLTISGPEVTTEVTTEVMQIPGVLDGEMSRRELQDALGLRNSEHFRKAYLLPCIRGGLIEMTLPDRPRSSRQRYRLTRKGRSLREGDRS